MDCRLGSIFAENGWTKTHGFFAVMGGFMLFESGKEPCTLSLFHLKDYVKSGVIDITKAEIQDKSRGDILSKGLVILQTGWFMRFHGHLLGLTHSSCPIYVTHPMSYPNPCRFSSWYWSRSLEIRYISVSRPLSLLGSPSHRLLGLGFTISSCSPLFPSTFFFFLGGADMPFSLSLALDTPSLLSAPSFARRALLPFTMLSGPRQSKEALPASRGLAPDQLRQHHRGTRREFHSKLLTLPSQRTHDHVMAHWKDFAAQLKQSWIQRNQCLMIRLNSEEQCG